MQTSTETPTVCLCNIPQNIITYEVTCLYMCGVCFSTAERNYRAMFRSSSMPTVRTNPSMLAATMKLKVTELKESFKPSDGPCVRACSLMLNHLSVLLSTSTLCTQDWLWAGKIAQRISMGRLRKSCVLLTVVLNTCQ